LAKNIKIPGFRPGKAPKAQLEKYIPQTEVMQRSVNKVIQLTYKEMMKEEKIIGLDIIEDALKVDVEKFTPNELIINYIFENFPSVTLPDFKELAVEIKEKEITKEELDNEMNNFIKKDMMLIEKENKTIENGDVVFFDFEGSDEEGVKFEGGSGKNFELEIGSKKFIPGFEEQMIGLKLEEEKTIDVTFPSDYGAKNLAGKVAHFKLNINEIKQQSRPELNEEYFKTLNLEKEIKTVEEFENYVSGLITEKNKNEARTSSLKVISEYLINNSKLSYTPPSLLNAEVERLIKEEEANTKRYYGMDLNTFLDKQLKMKKEEFNELIKTNAKKNILLALVLEECIDKFNLDIDEEELRTFAKSFAQKNFFPAKMIDELIKNKKDELKSLALQEKLFDYLIEKHKK
jgi:trigger factor